MTRRPVSRCTVFASGDGDESRDRNRVEGGREDRERWNELVGRLVDDCVGEPNDAFVILFDLVDLAVIRVCVMGLEVGVGDEVPMVAARFVGVRWCQGGGQRQERRHQETRNRAGDRAGHRDSMPQSDGGVAIIRC